MRQMACLEGGGNGRQQIGVGCVEGKGKGWPGGNRRGLRIEGGWEGAYIEGGIEWWGWAVADLQALMGQIVVHGVEGVKLLAGGVRAGWVGVKKKKTKGQVNGSTMDQFEKSDSSRA